MAVTLNASTTTGLVQSADTSGIITLQNNGTNAVTITSGNLQFNSGYGSVATAYGCRSWVNFNGTGTPAIRASGNVTSITDGGTGIYEIVFTTAMPDANYASVGMSTDNRVVGSGLIGVNTASACKISVQSSGTLVDEPYIFVAIFR
tara:strand:+ start:53 stop:493 length:441 start_codon:yes stop_codon:yes gene_type:complete